MPGAFATQNRTPREQFAHGRNESTLPTTTVSNPPAKSLEPEKQTLIPVDHKSSDSLPKPIDAPRTDETPAMIESPKIPIPVNEPPVKVAEPVTDEQGVIRPPKPVIPGMPATIDPPATFPMDIVAPKVEPIPPMPLSPVKDPPRTLNNDSRPASALLTHQSKASPIETGRDIGDLSVFTHDPDAAQAAALQERKRHLAGAVASLPARYREIVILCKFEELPQKIVAERLGLSPRTVENLLARALKKVEAKLRRRGVVELYER